MLGYLKLFNKKKTGRLVQTKRRTGTQMKRNTNQEHRVMAGISRTIKGRETQRQTITGEGGVKKHGKTERIEPDKYTHREQIKHEPITN